MKELKKLSIVSANGGERIYHKKKKCKSLENEYFGEARENDNVAIYKGSE